MFGPAVTTQEFKKTEMAGECWGGVDKVRDV